MRNSGPRRLWSCPLSWAAYALPRQAWDEIDASIERQRAGDFTGCTPMADLDDASAGFGGAGGRHHPQGHRAPGPDTGHF
ncbi:hypothetical protein [Streptomyces albipurpureus]|uniref:Transposase n=1 Tax=Streptomyces albipurpureus TaxID=2897419 RepID=A0ABT0V435_9ACTN|nr:hypothetical protein [Streptomyces sp. CWNU-1]MCM2394313.1 hypothetical protein [Streptomyces sp. CWNU-1]